MTKAKPIKPRARRLHPFDKEIIASIQNEKRTFQMERFVTGNQGADVATCKTACCMAGHIEALRRPLAKRLAKQGGKFGELGDYLCHDDIAAEIYRRETGKECPLDFMGSRTMADLDDLTREDAVNHIKGVNLDWPLLET